MSRQREKPGWTIEELNVTLGRPADAGGYMSGGQIENFREGWAKEVFGGKVAHWFKRQGFDNAYALCGHSADVRWLYGRGNWPCCSKCVKVKDRKNSAAIVREEG